MEHQKHREQADREKLLGGNLYSITESILHLYEKRQRIERFTGIIN